MKNEEIEIKHIRIDGGTQTRAGLNSSTLAEYVLLLAESDDTWPFRDPIELIYDGSDYWLVDGFHRVQACKQHGRFVAIANVQQGTQRDAVLYSVGANADHGLPRSQDDKRRAVQRLLEDDEWNKWSDREIARRCKVSAPLVGKLRSELTVNIYSDRPEERTYVRNGTVATMNTNGIGRAFGYGDPDLEPKPATRAQRQEELNQTAVTWLRSYTDDHGRDWNDLTDNQTHHANAPCYQAFVKAYPDGPEHKFALKRARAILRRELENQQADEKIATALAAPSILAGKTLMEAFADAERRDLPDLNYYAPIQRLLNAMRALDKYQVDLMIRAGDILMNKDDPAEEKEYWNALADLLQSYCK